MATQPDTTKPEETQPAAGIPPRPTRNEPYWDLRVEPDGRLTAVLTGTNPPLTVTGDDLASLRKQIRTIVMRAML